MKIEPNTSPLRPGYLSLICIHQQLSLSRMADVMYRGDIAKKLEKMWNKPKYSDTLFLVNNSKFHASSHLVSASSDVLDSLLDTHYQNCDDREITMGGIKNDESFLVVLKCIYGIELNLTQMSTIVMCEVLRLCETYGLTDFSNTIKCFLSTLDCFQLDSLVILLNTAKKFSLKELYEKLSVFAYDNADQLVKHKSFADLQFDVLQDLLKSDWFFASEIDILTGALIWHSDNMNQSPSNVLLDLESGSTSGAEVPDDIGNSQLDADGGETDQTETSDSKSFDKKHKNKRNRNKKTKKIVAIKSAGSPSVSFNKINLNAETLSPDQTDSCAELVKTFSDNVLKTLLSHIRMKQISFFESLEVFETELFSRYKVFLTGTSGIKYMSKINQPRVKYMSKIKEPSIKYAQVAVAPILHDITKKYTVKFKGVNIMCESDEKYLIGDMEWKVGLRFPCLCDTDVMLIYLKCISTKQSDWECTTENQFKILPCVPGHDPLVLPEDGSYKSVTLTSGNSGVEVCQYDCGDLDMSDSWYDVYAVLRDYWVFTIEVNFKSIHIKTK